MIVKIIWVECVYRKFVFHGDMKTANGEVCRSARNLMTNSPAVKSAKGQKRLPRGCLREPFLGTLTSLPLKNLESLVIVNFVCLNFRLVQNLGGDASAN